MADDEAKQQCSSPSAQDLSPSHADNNATGGTPATTPTTPINRPQNSIESSMRTSKLLSGFNRLRRGRDLSEQAIEPTAYAQKGPNDQQQLESFGGRNCDEPSPGLGGRARKVLGLRPRRGQKNGTGDAVAETGESVSRFVVATAERNASAVEDTAEKMGSSTIDNTVRRNLEKWSSPVATPPKDFDINAFDKYGKGMNILSDVTERTEDDHLSDVEDGVYVENAQVGARTIAGVTGGERNRESTHQVQGDAETFGSESSMKKNPSFFLSASEQETDLEPRRSRPRRARRRASTTYFAPTQASMARQTEKVELAPSRRNSRGALKELPGRIITTRRSASALGDRNRRSSPRRRSLESDVDESASAPEAEPLSGFSTPDRSTSNSGADDRPKNVEQEPPMVTRWLTGSPPGSANVGRESDVQARVESLEDESARVREEIEYSEGGMQQSTKGERTDDEKLMNAAESQGDDVHDDCTTRLRIALGECAKAREEKRLLEIKLTEMRRERDDAATQLKKSQQKAIGATDDELQRPVRAGARIETLQAQISGLGEKIEEMTRELESKSRDIKAANLYAEQAEEELERSDEYTEKLRREVEELTSAINRVSQISPDRTPDVTALKGLTQVSEFNPETNALHSGLLQLAHHFDNRIQSLSARNVDVQQQLANKEHELALVMRALRADAGAPKSSVPAEKQPWEIDHDTFEQLYRKEQRRRELAEERQQKFRNTAEKWYQPDLERKNKELQIDLNRTRDENARLHEQVKKYKGRAQQWESEYKNSKVEHEKRTAGLKDEVKRQRIEMLVYIKEYHDKTQDPEHWELAGLQKRIRALERDLQMTNELFALTKSEKAKLEDEVSKLMNTNTRYEEDIERLGKAWIVGGAVPPPSAPGSDHFDSSSDSSSASSSSSWLTRPKKAPHRGPYVPRCHHIDEIKKRETIMRDFREAQEKRRQEEKLEGELMERVRAWKMGKLYPPKKKGWGELLAKSSWERWDGEEWLEVKATWKDKGIVEAMRAKGLL